MTQSFKLGIITSSESARICMGNLEMVQDMIEMVQLLDLGVSTYRKTLLEIRYSRMFGIYGKSL